MKLTDKPVRRIYKLDIDDLIAQIKGIEEEIKEVKNNLANLTDYAVNYYEGLLKNMARVRSVKQKLKNLIPFK